VNYANSYDDPLSQPVREVSEWTTVDLLATYSTARGRDLLSNVTISLGALNVFDKDPPFVNQTVGFDPTNAQPYGRMFSVQLTKGWGDGSN
jgi:outer membrane receptor protein involved in Fe transport